jgi:Zn-dependent peptidase ImmA (M78 family)
MDKQEIRKIVKRALKTRLKQSVPIDESFCVIDMAKELGIEVKFVDLKSLEGAYLNETETILLSTLRPEGRVRFTCAHEIGHFIFKHGDSFDEVVEKACVAKNKIEERMCDIFASFLLMPETTVNYFFQSHGWNINAPKPTEVFMTTSWLGVSYSSLVNHLYYGLKKIDKRTFDALLKVQPRTIKSELTGIPVTSNLVVVDNIWKGRPLDLQVDDYLLLSYPVDIPDGILAKVENSEKDLYRAEKPGLSTIHIKNPKGGIALRVRRKEYVGRGIFRHLSED